MLEVEEGRRGRAGGHVPVCVAGELCAAGGGGGIEGSDRGLSADSAAALCASHPLQEISAAGAVLTTCCRHKYIRQRK